VVARDAVALAVFASIVLVTPRVAAYGEENAGFPKWSERVLHEWTNRARSDPAIEMTACGSACGEKGSAAAPCYAPIAPLVWEDKLGRSARFHADNMQKMSFFAHDSICALVPSLATLYPTSCQGEEATSCQPNTTTCCLQGTAGCNAPPYCTPWSSRVALFGASPSSEIIASPSDPNGAFYAWLFEPNAGTTCAYSGSDGHRWAILKMTGRVGYGVASHSVGDFASGGTTQKIPSGSHYPKQAATVDAWASWYDTAAPQGAVINVDGTCSPMTRTRGVDTNGAWHAAVTGVGTGCHRYVFVFTDATGGKISYPTTGSLGIGDATCADWDTSRPPTGAGCGCTPACGGKTCGDDGCGGSCGTCDGTCSPAGACTPATDAGAGDGGASSSSSGSSGASSGGASSGGASSGASGDPSGGGADLASAPLPSNDASSDSGGGGCTVASPRPRAPFAAFAAALFLAAGALARRSRRPRRGF
jgi:hypothetical protein